MAKKWNKFPHADKSYVYDGAKLKQNWARLHRGDCEPYPKDAHAQEAWRLYHAGEFQQAVELGNEHPARPPMPRSRRRRSTRTISKRTTRQSSRFSRKLRRGLTRGAPTRPPMPTRITSTRTPWVGTDRASRWPRRWRRASAARSRTHFPPRSSSRPHTPMRTSPSERTRPRSSTRSGALVAGMTYGAKKDSAIEHFQKALKLNPDSAIGRIEYGNGADLALRQEQAR